MTEKLLPCPFCGGEAKIGSDYNGIEVTYGVHCPECHCAGIDTGTYSRDEAIAAWNRRAQLDINGDTSDGYHTFNELYHHRAVLFSAICNEHPDIAWKSKHHHDGTMYEGMFIVGLETPDGQATYHYDIEPYWSYFSVPRLERAPEWDGHTPKDAINRLLHLGILAAARRLEVEHETD